MTEVLAALALTVDAIVANTVAYGFTVKTETVHSDGKAYTVPMFVPTDVAKLFHYFPAAMQSQMTGASSLRVQWQGVVRRLSVDNVTIKQDALLRAAIARVLLRERAAKGGTRVEIQYRVTVGGKHFAQPLSDTDAAEVLAILVDAGFDDTTARDVLEVLK